jgi:peptidyl-prolyl cis-trans isomerase SurA
MIGRILCLIGRILCLELLSLLLIYSTEMTAATVVATVGDDPVDLAEVQRMVELVFHDKKPTGELLPMAQAQVLEEIVNRRLVLAFARRTGDLPGERELAKAKKQLQLRVAAQGGKASTMPRDASKGDADLDRQVLWRLAWDRYLAKYRTPQRRQAWFKAHHRDLDGTQLAVSHILLQPVRRDDLKELDALEKRAAEIRTEISSGKIDFAQAAAKYSAGPSGKQGGKLGKIGRHGPMDEAFSHAAFVLETGQISPPIRSSAGVHLIRCEEIVPGTKQLADVKDAIDAALAQELLVKISNFERDRTEVKYTDAWPHFKPGTQELVK